MSVAVQSLTTCTGFARTKTICIRRDANPRRLAINDFPPAFSETPRIVELGNHQSPSSQVSEITADIHDCQVGQMCKFIARSGERIQSNEEKSTHSENREMYRIIARCRTMTHPLCADGSRRNEHKISLSCCKPPHRFPVIDRTKLVDDCTAIVHRSSLIKN